MIFVVQKHKKPKTLVATLSKGAIETEIILTRINFKIKN